MKKDPHKIRMMKNKSARMGRLQSLTYGIGVKFMSAMVRETVLIVGV